MGRERRRRYAAQARMRACGEMSLNLWALVPERDDYESMQKDSGLEMQGKGEMEYIKQRNQVLSRVCLDLAHHDHHPLYIGFDPFINLAEF